MKDTRGLGNVRIGGVFCISSTVRSYNIFVKVVIAVKAILRLEWIKYNIEKINVTRPKISNTLRSRYSTNMTIVDGAN